MTADRPFHKSIYFDGRPSSDDVCVFSDSGDVDDVSEAALLAVADALTRQGRKLVLRIEAWRGWGGAVMIQIYAVSPDYSEPQEVRRRIKLLVSDALRGQRHHLEITLSDAA